MKQVIIALLLVFACGLVYAEQISFSTGGATVSIEISGVDSDGDVNSGAIIDAIADRLETLDNQYVSQLKRLEQERARKIVNEIFALLAQLPVDQTVTISSNSSQSVQSTTVSMDVNMSGMETMEVADEPAPPVEPAGPQAMSAGDFAQLKRDVQAEDFGDDMLGVVEVAAQRNHFSVDQIRQLVQLFDFSDEQVQVVRITWPKVVDSANGSQLLSAFEYSDDKQQVRGIISQ